MRKVSPKQIKTAAAEGKNQPIARSVRLQKQQNGEVEPSRESARRQPGTDEAAGR